MSRNHEGDFDDQMKDDSMTPSDMKNVNHGLDCKKEKHLGEGYLHCSEDDRPYEVDGLIYCGRCHVHMGWTPMGSISNVKTTIPPQSSPPPLTPKDSLSVEVEEMRGYYLEKDLETVKRHMHRLLVIVDELQDRLDCANAALQDKHSVRDGVNAYLEARLAEVEKENNEGWERVCKLEAELHLMQGKLHLAEKQNKEWSEAIDCWAKTPQGLRDEMEEMEKEIKDLKDDLKEQTPEATQWYIRKLQDQLATAQAQLRRKDEALENLKTAASLFRSIALSGEIVSGHAENVYHTAMQSVFALADGKEGGR